MWFRFLASLAFAACAAVPALGSEPGEKSKPNVIFILTDDLGWGDLGVAGHPYLKTPNLDRLARGGTRFTQFYVNNPVCSPSRTAFMTGRYPARFGIHGHLATPQQNRDRGMPDWLDPDAVTVCDLMRSAGYRTAHIGKWHLGTPGAKGAPSPAEYGLDFHKTVNSPEPAWRENDMPYFRAKSTGIFVDEAIQFIEAGKGRPFYIQLWTLVPHAKLDPTPAELKVYEGLDVEPGQFRSYMKDYAAGAKDLDQQARVFAAAVTGLDKAIGRLLDYLDEHGLADNTIIVFASDNGPEDYHIRNAANAGMGSTWILRGRKRSLYEGGVRVPCIVRWPRKVPANKVNTEAVWTGVDLLPTLASIVGVDAPKQLDGEDVSDILRGSDRARSRPILWEWRFNVAGDKTYAPPPLAIRDGNWKLYATPDRKRIELYDVVADPEERRNVAAANPGVVDRLTRQLLDWKKTLPQ